MDLHKLLVKTSSSIREAIKIMDKAGVGVAFVVNSEQEVEGLVTDGDFRRAVLKGINLEDNISLIANREFISLAENESEKEIINAFLKNRIDRLPVLSEGKLHKLYLREEFNLKGKVVLPEENLNIPVVIMAGGKGTRMAPFTHILPKPLIPIGERSMLEVIMDEYGKFGLNNFYLSINYKGNLIKAYFDDLDHSYKLSYIREDKYLGTAGALRLLDVEASTPVFVTNCDIIIKDNYLNILEFHKTGKYDLTLVAAMFHQQIPYGVCKLKEGGELDKLSEKPEYDYLVNSGMYILNSSVLKLIPENEFFHITHLMEEIKKSGGKIGVYPVSENSWIDIGRWEEYKQALNNLSPK